MAKTYKSVSFAIFLLLFYVKKSIISLKLIPTNAIEIIGIKRRGVIWSPAWKGE
jgi:hypothetical protein